MTVEYTLDRWQTLGLPNRVHVSAREQHGASNPRWQESYSYSDGSGHEVMKKVQAEPGQAPELGPDGKVVKDASGNVVYASATSRWVGTGRTVFDNKGNPVKQYEPYFSATFEFEDDTNLVNWGVTPILRYDPLGRLVRTDLPNGTYTKSVFDAWHVEAWDPNDTVADSLWYAARSGLSQTTGEGRAAVLALAHAGTPGVTYLDAQGRTFLAMQDNAGGTKYLTRSDARRRGQRARRDGCARQLPADGRLRDEQAGAHDDELRRRAALGAERRDGQALPVVGQPAERGAHGLRHDAPADAALRADGHGERDAGRGPRVRGAGRRRRRPRTCAASPTRSMTARAWSRPRRTTSRATCSRRRAG